MASQGLFFHVLEKGCPAEGHHPSVLETSRGKRGEKGKRGAEERWEEGARVEGEKHHFLLLHLLQGEEGGPWTSTPGHRPQQLGVRQSEESVPPKDGIVPPKGTGGTA